MAISTATTAGQILTSAYVNNNINSGYVYIASKTFTLTSSAQQIDNCFTSTYDNYRITFAGIGSAATSVFVTAQLVDGTTPVTSGIYFRSHTYGGTSTMVTGFQGSQTSFYVGMAGDTASAFTWDLLNPQAAAKTLGTSTFMTSATNDFFNGNTGSMVNNTTQYEGISFVPASGSWAGTITVLGMRKA